MGSAARRVAPLPSSGRSLAEAAVAVPHVEEAADAADGVRSELMRIPTIWLCMTLAAVLWPGIALAASSDPPAPQRTFASAEDAANAFVTALRNHQEADLRAILGPEADRILDSGDAHADEELHQRFLGLYDAKHSIEKKGPGHAELDAGPDDWPLPIPLVEKDGRWTFDTAAGAQTIVDRRVGRNELSAIRTLLASVDAQHAYFDLIKQQIGRGVYTTRFISTPDHHDGLYWPVAAGEPESPLGPLIEAAQEAGYPGELIGEKPIPYEGYNLRILTAQGPNGDGGARSYMQSGHLTGGFALVAWPAVYESSGIMTFIAGPDGDVYQKDLGPETASIAATMSAFDPDLTWSRVAWTNE